MGSIKITGAKELQKHLKEGITMKTVKATIRKNGEELQKKMQDKADFKGHWGWERGVGRVWKSPTGKTKETIMFEMSNGDLTATVEPTTEYSPYLEFGTRYMQAQPFVRPAFEAQLSQFKSDMQKLVK